MVSRNGRINTVHVSFVMCEDSWYIIFLLFFYFILSQCRVYWVPILPPGFLTIRISTDVSQFRFSRFYYDLFLKFGLNTICNFFSFVLNQYVVSVMIHIISFKITMVVLKPSMNVYFKL